MYYYSLLSTKNDDLNRALPISSVKGNLKFLFSTFRHIHIINVNIIFWEHTEFVETSQLPVKSLYFYVCLLTPYHLN